MSGNGFRSVARWSVARLGGPRRMHGSNGVAFGPDGRLYVAQFLAGQISAVDTASGDVEITVGAAGPVLAPDDLAFGADGSMYIADLTPGRVWRRDPAGEFSLVAENLNAPNGITCVGNRLFVNEMCLDGRVLELFPDGGEPVVLTDGLAFGNAMQPGPDGKLYYPHMITGEVWRISPEGGAPELVAEQVHEPVAVRFDRGGVLRVVSRGVEGFVTTFEPGTGARSVVSTGIPGLDNAAFDEENRMLVSSYASGGITAIETDAPARPVVRRGLNGPFGVAAGAGGEVYAGDHFRLATGAELGTAGVLQQRMGGYTHGVAVAAGLVHVTSQYGDVRTFEPATETVRARATGLAEPVGIVVVDGALVVAEAGAGRVLRIDEDDTVTVLAEGLQRPSDVTVDAAGRCYVSDEQAGAVLRIADGATEIVAEGLSRPQGVAVRGEELFVLETGNRTLTSVSLRTGERAVEVEDLPVGSAAATDVPQVPGPPRPFAALATADDGSLLLAANGEGTVLRLSPAPGE